jgi:hypothetical protein
MRDLIDLLDKILTESQVDEAANLAASEILSRSGRFETFIDHIKNKRPFYTHDDQEVIVDPDEADRFVDMYTQKQFTGNIKAQDINGQFWPLSQFKKTSEFGGSGVKPGEKGDVSKMSKDAAKLKPAEIGITGKDIAAGDLGSVIVSNPVLQATVSLRYFVRSGSCPRLFFPPRKYPFVWSCDPSYSAGSLHPENTRWVT